MLDGLVTSSVVASKRFIFPYSPAKTLKTGFFKAILYEVEISSDGMLISSFPSIVKVNYKSSLLVDLFSVPLLLQLKKPTSAKVRIRIFVFFMAIIYK